jgi:hypothetical protein
VSRAAPVVAGLAVLVAIAAGCASADDLTADAQRALHGDVAALRAAVRAGDRSLASRRLAALLVDLDHLDARGDVSRAAAGRIERAAEAVARDLALVPAPPTTSSTTTTTTTLPPTTSAPRVRREPKHKRHHGDG